MVQISGSVVRSWLFVVRVWGSGFRVSGFGFRTSDLGLWFSGFWFLVSGFGLRVSNFGFRVSRFGFRVSGFGFQISDFGFLGSEFGCGVYHILDLRPLGPLPLFHELLRSCVEWLSDLFRLVLFRTSDYSRRPRLLPSYAEWSLGFVSFVLCFRFGVWGLGFVACGLWSGIWGFPDPRILRTKGQSPWFKI